MLLPRAHPLHQSPLNTATGRSPCPFNKSHPACPRDKTSDNVPPLQCVKTAPRTHPAEKNDEHDNQGGAADRYQYDACDSHHGRDDSPAATEPGYEQRRLLCVPSGETSLGYFRAGGFL